MNIDLNSREITLLRLGLLQRCLRLKDRPDMKFSYDDSVALLHKLHDVRETMQTQTIT